MAIAVPTTPGTESPEVARERWRRRIDQARQAQRTFHGTWAVNLAFAAGQQWLVWDDTHRQLRSIQDVDDRYRDADLYTADRITEQMQAQLGELTSDDERPELLVAQEGDDAEKVAEALNRMAAFAWEHEWGADNAILRMRRLLLPLGVCAIRCKWDPNAGPQAGYSVSDQSGQAITDPTILEQLKQTGQMPDGSLPNVTPKREGRTVWEVYSSFQLLTPPGVVHEDDFTWEAVMRPVPVETIQDTYGVRVNEDTDIASGIGIPSGIATRSGTDERNRLRGHAWLYTCFDRPGIRYPDGEEWSFAGPNFTPCDYQPQLRYERPGQSRHSGVVYFHWWRLSDRFQSKSFVEGLKDPQRIINRRKTQNVEIIDRNMPRTYVREGDMPKQTGKPAEYVTLTRQANPPQFWQGAGPGQWQYQDIASLDDDLSHASTLSQLRLGENPASVQNFSQLALLNDNEHGKRQTVQVEQREGIAALVELSVSDMRKYWPQEKQAQIVGDDDRIEQATFFKDTIPAEYRVKVAKGQPLPKSQGAEVKKIDAIWAAAVECGAVATDPIAWTSWYKDSLEAGSVQGLPTQAPTTQQQIAHLENSLMRHGEEPVPAYYDNIQLHLPIHREEEDQARAMGDAELAARIERHLQASLQMAQQATAAAAPPAPPGLAPGPPGSAAPGQAAPSPQASLLQMAAAAPVAPQGGGGGGGFQGPPSFVPADMARLSGGQ